MLIEWLLLWGLLHLDEKVQKNRVLYSVWWSQGLNSKVYPKLWNRFPQKIVLFTQSFSYVTENNGQEITLYISFPNLSVSVAQGQWFPIVCEWIYYNRITHEICCSRIVSTFLNQSIIVVFGNLANTRGDTDDSLENIALEQWFSQRGPQSSSNTITQELVRNINPGVPDR